MLKQPAISIKHKKKAKLISQQNTYQKIKLIGQGTFGKVYLVKNKKDNKIYAVKQVLQDPKYKNRQLSIISRVYHENIIFMIDYFLKIHEQNFYLNIVMDFIPNSLSAMIKQQRKLKKCFDSNIRKILIFQLFKALYYMQLNSICHRDLKPPNILINDITLQLKICDFGSAKILQKKQKNVSYICSRYYRAPELILGSTEYSTEIDIWSAGCIMIEFLTLEPIFPGDSSVEQLIEIIKILGTPPKRLIDIYEEANCTELPLPLIKPNLWERILKKYSPEPQFIDLIEKVLTYDTQKRLKPSQILIHPYFHDLPNVKYSQYTQKLPKLFDFTSLNNKKNKVQLGLLDKFYNGLKNKKQKQSELTLKSKEKMLGEEVTITQSSSTYSEAIEGSMIMNGFGNNNNNINKEEEISTQNIANIVQIQQSIEKCKDKTKKKRKKSNFDSKTNRKSFQFNEKQQQKQNLPDLTQSQQKNQQQY